MLTLGNAAGNMAVISAHAEENSTGGVEKGEAGSGENSGSSESTGDEENAGNRRGNRGRGECRRR